MKWGGRHGKREGESKMKAHRAEWGPELKQGSQFGGQVSEFPWVSLRADPPSIAILLSICGPIFLFLNPF